MSRYYDDATGFTWEEGDEEDVRVGKGNLTFVTAQAQAAERIASHKRDFIERASIAAMASIAVRGVTEKFTAKKAVAYAEALYEALYGEPK